MIKYLGTFISSYGRNETGILSRIAQVEIILQRLKSVLPINASPSTQEEELQTAIFGPSSSMNVRLGQFQYSYKGNLRQQNHDV